MKKSFVKLFLSLFVVAFSFVFNAQTKAEQWTFPDVAPNHWAASQIKELSAKGVIVGYPDGTFKPDENVTRAEFASMAIWALGQQHTTVAQPVAFTDIDPSYWAYDMIQRALYFELIACPLEGEPFRPEDNVSHAEAVTVIVNALTTTNISEQKAREVLKKYPDLDTVPEWYVVYAGKAEILNMNVQVPGKKPALNAYKPATRAEIAVLLKNMMEQAKLNPNKKLADAMRKKTGSGYVLPQALVKGSIGYIPAGCVVPVQLAKGIDSQTSKQGQLYMAKAPQNYVTKENFILIYKGTNLQGHLKTVTKGKLFFRNGALVLENDSMTTLNDQRVSLKATGEVTKNKNKFVAFLRKIFKGEKLKVYPHGTVFVKLTQPLRIDLTNGWVLNENDSDY